MLFLSTGRNHYYRHWFHHASISSWMAVFGLLIILISGNSNERMSSVDGFVLQSSSSSSSSLLLPKSTVIFDKRLIIMNKPSTCCSSSPTVLSSSSSSSSSNTKDDNNSASDDADSHEKEEAVETKEDVRRMVASLLERFEGKEEVSLGTNSMDNGVLDEKEDSDGNFSVIDQSRYTKVYIVGSGLSDTLSSLSLSTLALLCRADVVLYDSLSLPESEIVKIVPNHCVVACVGKRGGDKKKSMKQKDIDDLLLHHLQNPPSDSSSGDNHYYQKRIIVRLKGGDPMLFGRTQSEVKTLRTFQQQQQNEHDGDINNKKHIVNYDIIPGMSSCIAGPHLAGIPLTDPTLDCQSFAVFTGTNAQGIGLGDSMDYDNITNNNNGDTNNDKMKVDTLVFLMIGTLVKLQSLCDKLSSSSAAAHWNKDTPCAIVQNAGRASQRVWRATLSTIVPTIQNNLGSDVTSVSPAIFIVGRTTTLDLRDKQ